MLRFTTLLASLMLWHGVATGAAQPERQVLGPGVASEGNVDAQRSELAAAIAAYEAGDFVRAQELFERVHAVSPTARTLRSLALVAYKQGHFAQALELFEASLESHAKPLSADMRADVQSLMVAARAELAREAEPVPEQAVALPVLAITQPAAPAPSGQLVVAQPPKSAAKPISTRTRRLRRAGFGLLGVAGASLLAGGAALLTGALRLNDIEATCRANSDRHCSPEAAHELERAARLDLLSALATAGFALAGASAVASATTLTLSYQSGRGSERHAPVVALTFRRAF